MPTQLSLTRVLDTGIPVSKKKILTYYVLEAALTSQMFLCNNVTQTQHQHPKHILNALLLLLASNESSLLIAYFK